MRERKTVLGPRGAARVAILPRTPRPQSVHPSLLAALVSFGLLAPIPSGAEDHDNSAVEKACVRRTSADVKNTVKRILVEHLGVEQSKVTPTSTLVGDLGADSLDVVELVMACEEEFSIEITDEAAEKIKTVQNLVDVISNTCPLPQRPPAAQH